MKVLITGINGFIGSFVGDYLLTKGYEVVGVGRRSNCSVDCEYIKADLANGLDYKDSVDYIIHAAAQSPYNAESLDDYIKGNIQSTQCLAYYAKTYKVKKIIYLSGISVYGTVTESIVTEKTPIVNPSVYGMTKNISEKIIKLLSPKIASIVLRLPGVVGKGSHTCWLSRVMHSVINEDKIEIRNPDFVFNNVVCLEDVAELLEFLLIKATFVSDIINVAANDGILIRDIVKYYIDFFDSNSVVQECPSQTMPFKISTDKLTSKYGYTPYSIKKTLEMHARSFKW